MASEIEEMEAIKEVFLIMLDSEAKAEIIALSMLFDLH